MWLKLVNENTGILRTGLRSQIDFRSTQNTNDDAYNGVTEVPFSNSKELTNTCRYLSYWFFFLSHCFLMAQEVVYRMDDSEKARILA